MSNRGGARAGAGRKRGSKSKNRSAIEARLANRGLDPIEALADIAQDPDASRDLKARVLIELAAYCHAKQRPEQPRRTIAIDASSTLEAQGRAVVAAIGAGELAPEEGAALLTGLARQGELEKVGMIADIVAKLAADRGLELPPELKMRQIPRTLPGGAQ